MINPITPCPIAKGKKSINGLNIKFSVDWVAVIAYSTVNINKGVEIKILKNVAIAVSDVFLNVAFTDSMF
mgnify:CR=1 FL=1